MALSSLHLLLPTRCLKGEVGTTDELSTGHNLRHHEEYPCLRDTRLGPVGLRARVPVAGAIRLSCLPIDSGAGSCQGELAFRVRARRQLRPIRRSKVATVRRYMTSAATRYIAVQTALHRKQSLYCSVRTCRAWRWVN